MTFLDDLMVVAQPVGWIRTSIPDDTTQSSSPQLPQTTVEIGAGQAFVEILMLPEWTGLA